MDDDVLNWTLTIEHCSDIGCDDNGPTIVYYYALVLRDGNGRVLFESGYYDTPEQAEREFDLSREQVERAVEELRAKHRGRY